MDAVATPPGVGLDPSFVSLAALPAGAKGHVVGVGSSTNSLSALERRLLEFGFVNGEQVEILAEARPGRDPFVVRIGHTTLALRRREAQSVWVELHHPGSGASPHSQIAASADRVEIQHPAGDAPPLAQVDASADRIELVHSSGTGPTP